MSAQTNPRSEQEEEIATKTTEPGHGVHSKPLRAFDGGTKAASRPGAPDSGSNSSLPISSLVHNRQPI